jgi:hypothetical protein
VPIQDAAVGDIDSDGRQELVVLEGGHAPGDAGDTVSIWRWYGWGFQREWRSARGRWSSLALQHVTGDGLPEIVAEIAIDASSKGAHTTRATPGSFRSPHLRANDSGTA